MNKSVLGKTEGKRPSARLRRRWEYSVKIDYKDIEYGMWAEFIWLRIVSIGGFL
jgi:hypothetical protein